MYFRLLSGVISHHWLQLVNVIFTLAVLRVEFSVSSSIIVTYLFFLKTISVFMCKSGQYFYLFQFLMR